MTLEPTIGPSRALPFAGLGWYFGFAAVLGAGCSGSPPPIAAPAPGLPAEAEQVLVVRPAGLPVPRVQVTAWERRGGTWAAVRPPMDGVIGPNGFAGPGAKREGDGKTPSGVYPLGLAFGYGPTLETGLEYRQATADDFWVDDPKSPQYNRWVTGRPTAASYEVLRRDDPLYQYAAVIGYNTDPVVPGLGSAIFLHVWRGRESPTAGCVALAEPDVVALLRWLDRRRHPVAALNPP